MARRSKARRYEVVLEDRAERGHGLCERRFWILAWCVVLISVLTQTFDFSLSPPAYKGLFITRPYCGLHDWHFSHLAWNARCHVHYGIGYTKGYRTSAVKVYATIFDRIFGSLTAWAGKLSILQLGDAYIGRN